MKFYFCEKCGARLTEQDLARGEANDKKLRGVFCRDCAVGVLTLETIPLDEARAREILNTPGAEMPAAAKPKRKTSGHRIMPAPRAAPRTNRTAADAPPNRRWIPAAILALAGLVLLAVFLAPASKPAPQIQITASTEGTPKPPRATHENLPPPVEPPAEPEPQPLPDEPQAPVAPEASQAPPEPEQAPAPPPEPAPAPVEPPAAPAPAVEQAQPPPAFDPAPLLDKLLSDLKQNGIAAAQERLAQEPAVPDELRARFAAALAQPLEWRKQARAALNAQPNKPLKLETKEGAVQGNLDRVDDEGIWVARRFQINGAWKDGPVQGVPWNELTIKGLRALVPAADPLPPDDALAMAFAWAGAGDAAAAEPFLAQAPAHPLTPALAAWIKKARAARGEEDARLQWTAWVKRLQECKSSAEAKELARLLEQWEAAFQATAFAQDDSQRKERLEFKQQLERIAVGLDPRVAKLFNGEIMSFDPRTQTIELHYDLKNLKHRLDFKYDAYDASRRGELVAGIVETPDGLRLYSSRPFNRVLHMPALLAGSATVIGKYKNFKLSYDGFLFGCAFGLEDSSGKAVPLIGLLKSGRAGADGTVGVAEFTNWYSQPKRKSEPLASVPPEEGAFEFSCAGPRYVIKLNETELIAYDAPEANDRVGFSIVAGRNIGMLITHLSIKGRIDLAWLREKLK
ncbi:MAG: hypothetical protein HS116_16870 [Planctomycetes bacterium]|nr:hypothetical protein [Planctomycetota bacterium]